MQACHCAGGNYGCLLDGASNASLTGKIAHFELGTIPEAAKLLRAVAGFLITNYTRQHIITMPRALRKRSVHEEVARLPDIPGRRADREGDLCADAEVQLLEHRHRAAIRALPTKAASARSGFGCPGKTCQVFIGASAGTPGFLLDP